MIIGKTHPTLFLKNCVRPDKIANRISEIDFRTHQVRDAQTTVFSCTVLPYFLYGVRGVRSATTFVP